MAQLVHEIEIVEGEIVSDGVSTSLAIPSTTNLYPTPDLMGDLVADKSNPNTERSYRKAWDAFFKSSPTLGELYLRNPAEAAALFCSWPPQLIVKEQIEFKNRMTQAGKSPATVNQRLAAVSSLLSWAFKQGFASTDGRRLVSKQKVTAYRDTRGIDLTSMKKLLKLPAKVFPDKSQRTHRLRDEAILRLLCENGIRNNSVVQCNVSDFKIQDMTLSILTKGYGNEKRVITLSGALCEAIEAYLRAAGHRYDEDGPLFRNFDHRPECNGKRLSNNGLRHLVDDYGKLMGIHLRPHKLRHSAITALLDATGSDVRAVQKFSGHAKIDTLLIYDDNRENKQGKLSNLLSGLLDDEAPKKRK